jgi:uncharacterized protein YcfJ
MKSLVRVAATVGGAVLGSILGNWLFGISLWLGAAVSAFGVVVIGYVEARSNEAKEERDFRERRPFVPPEDD